MTVLRSGGEYTTEHVERLREQCARLAPGVAFHCLSDVDVPGRLPLEHDWPGWFAKMEMFRLSGPCLYMDLDTTVVGDISPLLQQARDAEFTVLRDVYRGRTDRNAVQSSVMAWSGDMHWLYDAFRAGADRFVEEYRAPPDKWGDQGFIQGHAERRAYWQDALPGHLVSWKADCGAGVPESARLVFFHGKPRPWDVE